MALARQNGRDAAGKGQRDARPGAIPEQGAARIRITPIDGYPMKPYRPYV